MIPDRAITATSVVPPPTSTTMLPRGPSIGSPAPMAAAIGSDTIATRRAPAARPASRTARRSTSVMSDGTQMTSVGFVWIQERSKTWLRNPRISCSAMPKSAMTPSLSGRMARSPSGVRPSIRFASSPIATTRPDASIAATVGSSSTTPSPRARMSVFDVPRSIASSLDPRRRRRAPVAEGAMMADKLDAREVMR